MLHGEGEEPWRRGKKNKKDSRFKFFTAVGLVCAPGHFSGTGCPPPLSFLDVVLTGKGRYTAGGKTYLLTGGDAFFIRPMDSHYYQADRENPWEYAWVGFGGYEVETILEETVFARSPVYIGDGGDSEIGPIITKLVKLYEQKEQNWLILGGILMELLGRMPAKEKEDEVYEGQYLKKAIQYVEDNYSYDIKIQDMADWMGIDRTYLTWISSGRQGWRRKHI